MIRVLVAHGSMSGRRWIGRLLAGDPELAVAGAACSVEQMLRLGMALRPRVIVTSVVLLGDDVDGLISVLREQSGASVVIVGDASHAGDDSLRALAVQHPGWFSFVERPRATVDRLAWQRGFLNTIRRLSGHSVVGHLSAASVPSGTVAGAAVDLVAIGASAGGPKTIARMLAALPPLPVPVLIAMHFPPATFDSLIDWLSSVSTMPVVPAPDGAAVASLVGVVVIAQPQRHMIVQNGGIRLVDGPPVHHCKPAVDPLFSSVAAQCGPRCVGIVLTGMGVDGAAGLLTVRAAGGVTIAQDETTAEIFGMPKAAIGCGAAAHVLPDTDIPSMIVRCCQSTAAASTW